MKLIFSIITKLSAGYLSLKCVQEWCNPSWKESRKEGNWKNRHTSKTGSSQNRAQKLALKNQNYHSTQHQRFEEPELPFDSAPACHSKLENNN